MVKKVFCERLKQAREKKNISLKTLRENIGVSQSAMSHYANGTTLPTLDIAMKIAKELDVSVDWLCGKVDDKNGVHSLGAVARSIMEIWSSSIDARISISDEKCCLYVDSKELSKFFKEAIDLRKILNGDKINVYNIWEKAEFQRLDKIPYPQIGEFEEVDDDDLPF